MADAPLDTDYGSELFSWNKTQEEKSEGKEGVKVLGNILLILLFPAVLLSNLILFLMIVTRSKLRGDPWRLLIAHTSACILALTILLYSGLFTEVHGLPSLQTTAICPGVVFLERVLDAMSLFSLALVTIERFRSLIQKKDLGIAPRAILITLLVFWAFVLINQAVSLGLSSVSDNHIGQSVIYHEDQPGVKICRLPLSLITGALQFIFELFTFISIIVVITGIITTICKYKPSSYDIMNMAVAPLIYGTIYLCYFALVVYYVVSLKDSAKRKTHTAKNILILLEWIAFAVTWLVTWTLSGDLSWKLKDVSPCCYGKPDEQLHLLQDSNIKQQRQH